MTPAEALVAEYLQRLEHAAAVLPPDRRSELLEEIAEHISSAGASDEAGVRTLLDRLGEPEEIVAAARDDLPGWPAWAAPVPQPRGTGVELAAVLMLTLGSFLPVAGWLVGVVLLWTSPLWRAREKLLGTLVFPLGPGGVLLAGAFLPFLGGSETCSVSSAGVSADGLPPPAAPPPLPPPPDDALVGGVTGTVCTSTGVDGWLGGALLATLLLGPVLVAVLLLRIARRRAAERPVPAYGLPSTSPWGGLEIAGVLVLGLGGLVLPVVGPLVGLGLVLSSPRWTRTHKLVAAGLCVLPLSVPLVQVVLRALEGRVLL